MQAIPRRAHSWRSYLPLRYQADWRSLAFIATLFALFTAQWSGWARHWSLCVITAALTFVACIIKHNHIHCRTFASRRWNRAFDYALSFCTGQPISAIISIHNERHHGHYHTDRDCVRSSLVKFRSNILNLVVFPFAAIRAVHANKSADIARWRIEQPLLYRNLIAERIATMGSIATLLIIDWRTTVLFLGIPWIIGQWCIVAVNLIQHQECEHQSTYNHSRNLTGAMVNWLFMNNGFHTAHHLRPALHWSLLPKYHWLEVAPHMRADLNEPSLLSFLWRYLRECRS